VHIVQISYDASVFVREAPSDTRERQVLYGSWLERQRPGSRMTFLAFTDDPQAREFTIGQVRFHPITGRGPVRWLRLLSGLLFGAKPDVIATQTIFYEAWCALLAGWLRRVPVVGQVHFDLFAPEAVAENLGPGWIGRQRLALGLRLLRRLSAVRVVGERLKARLLAEGRHTSVAVIPVPVTQPPTIAGPPPATAQVLFVGRLVAAKNLRSWLRVAQRVAAQVPEAEFEWVGDGPLRRELQAAADELGLGQRLRQRGAVPYAELPGVYARAAVFLLTSHYEGFGRVVVEAGLAGRPVVAPRLTGVEDIIVEGETGYLHAPGDEAGLAASVVRLLRDADLRGRLGAAARRRAVDRFDPQRLAAAWVDFLIAAAEARP